MYFAMDEIGNDSLQTVLHYDCPGDRWRQLSEIADRFGFRGVQLTSHFYAETMGLPLLEMPACMYKYRLSYHIGGVRRLRTVEEMNEWSRLLEQGLSLAVLHSMEDVSLHPPEVTGGAGREESRQLLSELFERWLPRYMQQGVTLSLESHSDPRFFVFEGLSDYARFINSLPGLGVLMDMSHCYFDGYNAQQVVDILRGLKLTGLHLSDAIAGAEFRKGTHVPVGQGEVDFTPLLHEYGDNDDLYAALEIKGQASDIADSLRALSLQLTQALTATL